ncbi:MAG: tetratricopeptide repeat protein, partial [Candidatus Lokiarchaeota archaeon]
MSTIKKLSDLDITNLINKAERLTFLIGAGISTEAPSRLPTAQEMKNELIKYVCTPSEVNSILKIDTLKFETFLGVLHEILDEDLHLVDYYLESDRPNKLHFFISEMIKKGAYVITSNFDQLLEQALLKLDIPKRKLIPVITEKDFNKYDDPKKLMKNGKIPVYKIHGSPKNVITGEDTRESFINTINLISLNHDKQNIIQLEPYKSSVLENLTKGRSLIVIGYSGNNDYDILSSLKVLNELENIIWINHVDDPLKKLMIHEYSVQNVKGSVDLNGLDRILFDLKHINPSRGIYRIDIYTPNFIENFLSSKEALDSEDFQLELKEWILTTLEQPSELQKLFVSYKIYYETRNYTEALRCIDRIYRLAEESDDKTWKSRSLIEMGKINYEQDDYEKALDWFHKAGQILVKVKDYNQRSTIFRYIGLINQKQNNFTEATKYFDLASKEIEKARDLTEKSKIVKDYAKMYHVQEKFEEAIKQYESAIKFNEKADNPQEKANNLKEIGK